jgi:hypothetical protein
MYTFAIGVGAGAGVIGATGGGATAPEQPAAIPAVKNKDKLTVASALNMDGLLVYILMKTWFYYNITSSKHNESWVRCEATWRSNSTLP